MLHSIRDRTSSAVTRGLLSDWLDLELYLGYDIYRDVK